MITDSPFGVGFLRGLNATAELFAPYSSEPQPQPSVRQQWRSDWDRVGDYMKTAMSTLLASVPEDVSKQLLSEDREPSHHIASIISATWRGPLPPPAELERFEQIIPGGADRLLQLAEKEQLSRIEMAEKDQISRIEIAKNEQISRIEAAKNEQISRFKQQTDRSGETKRGQYLGWSLAMCAVVGALVASVCHGPWQVLVAAVGIPVLGAVQALIRGRK